MRKSFDSLSGLVRSELGKDPVSGAVFVFMNQSRNRLKLLHWEPGGFILYYKRLEKGTFDTPISTENNTISWTSLMLVIEGIRIIKSLQKDRFLL